MAIVNIKTRVEDVAVSTPLSAIEINLIIQGQLLDKDLAFLCVENHAFNKSEVTHIMVEPEDELPQELPTKENEECYMD